MAVRIRLARMGRKKRPFYRIVAANSEAKRDGSFLEVVGTYDPQQEPAAISIKHEKLQVWLDQGAQPTETVRTLIAKCPAKGSAE
jgi:small subunit ribosomal protein S16